MKINYEIKYFRQFVTKKIKKSSFKVITVIAFVKRSHDADKGLVDKKPKIYWKGSG